MRGSTQHKYFLEPWQYKNWFGIAALFRSPTYLVRENTNHIFLSPLSRSFIVLALISTARLLHFFQKVTFYWSIISFQNKNVLVCQSHLENNEMHYSCFLSWWGIFVKALIKISFIYWKFHGDLIGHFRSIQTPWPPNMAARSLKDCWRRFRSSSSCFRFSCSSRISSSNLLVLRMAAIWNKT